jgi:hypothetical protein
MMMNIDERNESVDWESEEKIEKNCQIDARLASGTLCVHLVSFYTKLYNINIKQWRCLAVHYCYSNISPFSKPSTSQHILSHTQKINIY